MVSLRHSCVHRSLFPRREREEPVETQETPPLSLLELSLLPIFLLPQLKPSSHLWALGAAPQFLYDLCPHYPFSCFLLPASLTSPWTLGPPTPWSCCHTCAFAFLPAHGVYLQISAVHLLLHGFLQRASSWAWELWDEALCIQASSNPLASCAFLYSLQDCLALFSLFTQKKIFLSAPLTRPHWTPLG